MKKALLFLALSIVALSATSQDKKVKTGWKFGGALPAVTYDTDLGFQYGALFEFFNYGDGSRYPDFFDHTYTEVSRFTKGSGIYRFMYESNHIIPGVHWTSDLSYLPDQASHFYGFNGYEAVFNKKWMDDEDPDYRTRMFYRFERNQFRFKNDFQGKLAGENIQWSAGFAFQNFDLGSVNIDKLNKGKKEQLPSVTDMPGLFERYRSLNLIPEDQAHGGWVNTVKVGIAWDSRDNRPNPMRGLWTEAGIEMAPGFMGNDWAFSKFYLTHRQYFTIIENDLSFVYRLGYQTTISGKSPFFYQSQVITSMLTGATNEGLGGASTLRGIMRNRVVGDGFLFGNLELRWKPVRFNLFNQDIYIGLNAFYDAGLVTNSIDLPSNLRSVFEGDEILFPSDSYSDYFNPGAEKLHQSAGISIMPVMNENFVIAVDIGKAFNKQDGNIGFSIGLNYLF
ncbi:MAG TPA: BamA/TamA family outer membrane protein [Bacteroidales bacterium]|nr:BamA/TamA family outer membrane protein [Bacteroidales bacterium]